MHHSKLSKTVFAMFVAGFVAGYAHAATIYVDATNNSGLEYGTSASPYAAIQDAINAAADGDVVSVAPGLYYGAIEMKSNVALVSQQGAKNTIIDGMGAYFVVNSPYSLTANSTLDGFTVQNGIYLIWASNRVNFWYPSTWTIRNSILKDGATAIQDYPGVTLKMTKTVITNVSTAMDAIWCSTPQFTNVTINNVGMAFWIYGISLNLINTTATNVGTFISLWGDYGSAYVYGSNNNIWSYTRFTVPNDRGYQPTMNLQNTISVDPLFVNQPTDLALQPGSPLIDAGTNVGLPFYGGAPDIGAYEYLPQNMTELVKALAASYARIRPEAFKNAGEQRRNALHNNFMAVLRILDAVKTAPTTQAKREILNAALLKLMNDVWAKGDGFYGGNPYDDWITTSEEQAALYPKVMEVKQAIESEIAGL